jgi:anti-sigma factor RsiW
MNQAILHLTDSELFAFLDGDLDSASGRTVEVHLVSCESCRVRRAAWTALFTDITGTPEIALERDLAPAVLAGLARRVRICVSCRRCR